jgi:1-aminocyclopropane-1-carboxylate deaminase
VHDLHIRWLDLGRVQISVLRADLCDPLLSGNKFFKLRYNLAAASESGHDTLLSFGGAWSNHLHALAAAGQRSGMHTIGVVRGESAAPLTECLAEAQAFGMHLHFVTRSVYRKRNSPEFLAKLQDQFGSCFVVPEGGANIHGVRGCQELLAPELAAQYSHVALACGTGTTLLGLVSSIRTPVLGIQVLKGAGYLEGEISAGLLRHGLQASAPWTVFDQFHRGGYARADAELLDFLERLERDTGLPLEPVYIGKVFMALQALIKAGHFAAGSRILVVHGGGLQGRRGFK